MKRFVITVALACVLSSPAMAGEVPSVGFTAPPPAQTSTPTAPGEIPSTDLKQEVSDAVLTFVQLVFGAVV